MPQFPFLAVSTPCIFDCAVVSCLAFSVDPRRPVTDEGQMGYAIVDPRHTLTCQISSRSVYFVALWRRKPQFCRFWTSAFSGVASWQQSEKVEHECTTTNLPLSKGIKIVSVLQHLHGEIGRTNSDVQKRDGQTN